MFSVYVLYSKSLDKYYVGSTEDVMRRLYQHNNPISSYKYSAKGVPWVLMANFDYFDSRSAAMKVELFIKKKKKRLFVEDLVISRENKEIVSKLLEIEVVG